MKSLSIRIIGILLMTMLVLPPAAWGVLDGEFNKNGEVYILLGKTEPGYPPRGIYKTCEYSVDDTGKRDPIEASEDDVRSGRVRISKGDGFSKNYIGLAVGRERECYTYVSEIGGWTSAGPDWKVRGRAEWWPGGCTAAHTASHAHTYGGQICKWRSNDRSKVLQGYSFPVGGKLTLRGSYDASRDEFTSFSGKTVVFPCSGRYQGWDGSDAPEPIGPWDWGTLTNGTRVKKSRSNEYMIPCGMFFHNLDSGAAPWRISHKMTNRGRGHCIFMYMGALKPTNLNKQTWQYKGGATPWTRTIGVGNYNRYDHPKVVFRLFEAKYHIYIVTPCGDGCLSSSSAAVQGAGNSHINITITPFGRTYGILTVKKASGELEKVELKRHDPDPAPDGKEYTYSPTNWKSAEPKLHLKVIKSKPGSQLYADQRPDAWTDARSIATSYKYDAGEVAGRFETKQEYVYLSDAPNFAVADTWFGSGGRAFFAEKQVGDSMIVTSQTRDEEKNKISNLFFKLQGKIQDIAADGYGNFFFLTTTDVKPVEDMMENNRNDFAKIKTLLTSKDKFGYSVAENYADTDWYTMDGEIWRKITFDMIIYKTIFKIGSATIDKEGKKTAGEAEKTKDKDLLSNPFSDNKPQFVGRIPIGRNSYARFAKKVGAVITFEPIKIMSADDRSDWPAELATLNIAAPPEEQGFNYYVDIKGPAANLSTSLDEATRNRIMSEERAVYDKYNDRVSKATDFTYEGETPTWSMENAPQFEGLYGLNTNTGGTMSDENGNGIVGSLRNNVIKESMAVRWLVYRLYDVKALGLPPQSVNANAPFPIDPDNAGGVLNTPQLGNYKYVKLRDFTKIYNGTEGWLRKDGRRNDAAFPGAIPSTNPFSFSNHFVEAGVYMVLMQLDFEYRNYSELAFGSNITNADDVRKTSRELEASISGSTPGFYTADPAHPVFLHTRDTRYVVVLARDANSDGNFIKKVSVNMIDGGGLKEGTPLDVLAVDEIERHLLPGSLPSGSDDQSASREAMNNATIDNQLKTKYVSPQKFIVGDFAIKFASALPDRETASGSADRNLVERFGGIGVWDYSPDHNPNHDETGASRRTLYKTTDSIHPPNYAALGRGDLTDMSLATVKPGTTDPYKADRKMLIKRNYGMHGNGTLVRALNAERIKQLQPTGATLDPGMEEEKLVDINVSDSFWNAGNGRDYPIREVDWDAVKYRWHVAYNVNGKIVREDNGKYSGTMGEVMRWCRKTGTGFPVPTESFFIERLGSRNLPGVGGGGTAKAIFEVRDKDGNLYGIDNAKMPAFHVRFPFLEKLNDGKSNPDGIPDFKPVRWETPIGPQVYHIGLEISAPALEWREDDSYKMRARLKDGSVVTDKQVFWDLYPWREAAGNSQDETFDSIDTARCGPIDDAKAADLIANNGNFGLNHSRVFVKDLEPPRLFYTRNSENVYTYPEGTTGDKYPGDVAFRIIDNNPNSTVDPATFAPKVNVEFPLTADARASRNLPKRKGSNIHDPETFTMTPPASTTYVEDTGKCFEFTISASQEMWGAPYAEMGFMLPAVSGGGAVTSDALTQDKKSNDSTPFMPPSYVGDLFYNVDITMNRVDWKGSSEAQEPFVLVDMWKDLMKYQVKDNDPPEVFIEVRTSFTEVDHFGLAVHHKDTVYDFLNAFTNPAAYASAYADSLKGNNPSSWPRSLVDARGPTPVFGTSQLTVMKKGSADMIDIASATDKNDDKAIRGDVATVRAKDPKYVVNIPERSRAIFSIQVVDNVPDAGDSHLLDPSATGMLAIDVIDSKGGTETPAMRQFKSDLSNQAMDPTPSKPRTWNLFGNFRLPMKDGENAAVSFKVRDAAANETEIQVPIFVNDTFIKQDRLDLEKERRD